ncbi:4-hydroxy-tetrahydrodipicolinate synthase [Candidatus Parcubacteria bacterium]|nr:MAG: 4-hydroxy-tetrahydrodipicolinate synthase [Candidatus Parcubacteria bacterium]
MFTGSCVALITPFKNGQVDYQKITALVERQIKNGTRVICPCGCTGQAATLSHDEQIRIIEAVVAAANGRVKVVAGTGSNSTHEAIILTRRAKEAGADAALMITPYYNKPTQDGLFKHYEAVAKEVDIPIVLYNVPGRTGVNMLPSTVARLTKIETIIAIKEASGNINQVNELMESCSITVLSGDDPLTLPMLALGAAGVVSVTANVAPFQVADMINTWEQGKYKHAQEIHFRLLPLSKILFCETNPIPVQWIMSHLGFCEDELRSPLFSLSEQWQPKILAVLEKLRLFKQVAA